ncbi:MAG: spermidine synthase, partial [Nitrospirae bacterium]
DLRFYNPQIHRSVFSLPNYLKTALEEETRINSDGAPLSFY